MYQDANGAPWTYPLWQETTGVRHGLFSKDDGLLPKGWKRSDATQVSAYFDQFGQKIKEDDKIKFASATKSSDQIPGRAVWRRFLSEGWRKWQIHAKITEILSSISLHPVTLALNANPPSLDNWPKAQSYLPMAVDAVGVELFGEDILDPLGRVQAELRPWVQAIIYRTWCNLRNQVGRSKVRLVTLEVAATDAFSGKCAMFISCLPRR